MINLSTSFSEILVAIGFILSMAIIISYMFCSVIKFMLKEPDNSLKHTIVATVIMVFIRVVLFPGRKYKK